MLKTEYMGWLLTDLKYGERDPDTSKWMATYKRLGEQIYGLGHTPEAAMAAVQKRIKLLYGGAERITAERITAEYMQRAYEEVDKINQIFYGDTTQADQFDKFAKAAYDAAERASGSRHIHLSNVMDHVRQGNAWAEAAQHLRRMAK